MKGKIGKKIVSLVFVIVAALVVAELILRNSIIPIEKKYHLEKGAVIKENVIGYRLRPNQRTIMSNGYFREEVITNKDGLRDVYDDNYKNYGLMAIGDSQTFGYGINANHTWVEKLQNKLGVNVINTGVLGYGVAQYGYVLRRLYEKGYPIRLVFYEMTWNDVTSGIIPADNLTVVGGYLVDNPKYRSKNVEKLSFFEKIQESKGYFYVINRLALGKLFLNAAKRIFGFFEIQAKPVFERELLANTEVTKEKILELKKFLDSIGAKLIIVHVAHPTFIMPELWDNYQRRSSHSKYYVREAFADWSKMHGIYFEDAQDDLENEYVSSGRRRTSVFLSVNDHYNKNANEVISEVFYRVITRNNLIPPLLISKP